jgi:hypothetical protein
MDSNQQQQCKKKNHNRQEQQQQQQRCADSLSPLPAALLIGAKRLIKL